MRRTARPVFAAVLIGLLASGADAQQRSRADAEQWPRADAPGAEPSRPLVSAAGNADLRLLVPAAVDAQQWPPIGGASRPGTSADTRIALGLREALTVGAANAVARTGRLDGFFRNEAIRILLPEKLRRLESGLRAFGYGAAVDEFVLAMNRAAERAASSAKPIFLDAIRSITIEDAKGILTGRDTAATDYFRGRTEEELASAFRPIVEAATNEFGVTRRYKSLVDSIPFGLADGQRLDVDDYVVGKTLDGLFYVLGEEERAIRRDPAARVTAILREIFGRRD